MRRRKDEVGKRDAEGNETKECERKRDEVRR